MNKEEMISVLRKKGLKVTHQRLAIYKYVVSRDDHPSAEQIYEALKINHPTISLATIYKNLHLLDELGLIQELGFSEGSIRYDPDLEIHINMVCTKCGKISDYKTKNINKFWNKMISDLQIKPKGQRIDIYYECEDCK